MILSRFRYIGFFQCFLLIWTSYQFFVVADRTENNDATYSSETDDTFDGTEASSSTPNSKLGSIVEESDEATENKKMHMHSTGEAASITRLMALVEQFSKYKTTDEADDKMDQSHKESTDDSPDKQSGVNNNDDRPTSENNVESAIYGRLDQPSKSNYHQSTENELVSDQAASSKKLEGDLMYEEAMRLLQEGGTRSDVRKLAFQTFYVASRFGHTKSREWVALGTLLGWGLYHSLPRAHAELLALSEEGNPRGQFGLGLMHATGLMVPASVPHALVYWTFGALGKDELASMALAYRYWAGIGVEENCESALTFYYRVAKVVAKEISDKNQSGTAASGGPMIRRARLLDEVDADTGFLSVFGFSDGGLGGSGMNEDLFQYYQFMADKNNVTAQVGLGQLYYYGRLGVDRDFTKALHYFQLAADAGSHLAKAYLGELYMTDADGFKPDPAKALAYLKDAAEHENPVGQSGLAMAYLHGRAGLKRDPAKAVELLILAANQGWADAQVNLGRLFLGSVYVESNFKLALKYFTLASQQGNTLAIYYLGEMHATGTGVIRSCSTAVELFKNVAERGRWSKWLMYAHDAYREQRYDEAFVTYQLLAELGYEVAESNLAFLLEEGKVSVVDKSEFHSRALVQWQRSASQGSTSARVKLGDYHYYGYGTNQSYTKAIQHYRIATEQQQNAQAMFNLAYMHEQGLGLKQDMHLAKRFYDLATESSIVAKIPVKLALSRLQIYFILEELKQSWLVKQIAYMFGRLSEWKNETIAQQPSPTEPEKKMDWDYYAIPILAGLLLVLIFYMYHLRRR